MAVKTRLVVMVMVITSVLTRLKVQSSKVKTQLNLILMIAIVLVECREFSVKWYLFRPGYNEACGELNRGGDTCCNCLPVKNPTRFGCQKKKSCQPQRSSDYKRSCDKCQELYRCLYAEEFKGRVCRLFDDDDLCAPPYKDPKDPEESMCVKCQKRAYSKPEEYCAFFELIQTMRTGWAKTYWMRSSNNTSGNTSGNSTSGNETTWPCELCFKHQDQDQTIQVKVYQQQYFRRYLSGITTIDLPLSNTRKEEKKQEKKEKEGNAAAAKKRAMIELVLIVVYSILIVLAIIGTAFFARSNKKSNACLTSLKEQTWDKMCCKCKGGNPSDPENNLKNENADGEKKADGKKKKKAKKSPAKRGRSGSSEVDGDFDDDGSGSGSGSGKSSGSDKDFEV